MNVLIVDDKEESRYLLESLLNGHGHTTATAANGEQGLSRLRQGGIDLVISDILMPVMDGFQLTRTIKADKDLCHIPVIIYTATYTGPRDEALAERIGAGRFLRKPSEPDAFMAAVMEVMEATRTTPTQGVYKQPPEDEVLQMYNERLVRKLEQKMLDLEKEVQARKATEEALRVSNTRLQVALKASKIGFWDWDLESNAVFFSPEWKQQIGYADHEIPNHYDEWESRLHSDDRPRVLKVLKEYLEGGGSLFNAEFRFRHKDGSYRWITAWGTTTAERDGQTRRMTGCHIDVTLYREAIQALDIERNKFRVLVEGSPLAIVLVDDDDRVRYLNPKFFEMFGYGNEEISSRGEWLARAYPDTGYRQEIKSMWRQAKETGDPAIVQAHSPLTIRCKNQTDKKVQCHTAFLDSGEQLVIYEDISEQARMEEQLRQSQKMEAIATLAGGIAHDFNNILSAVIGYAELAQDDLPPNSITADNIREVLVAGRRAKDLVGHILAFSRQDTHERMPTAPHLIVKEVLGLLKSTLPANIEIRVDAAPAGTVLADPTRLHQVIMNLCTNAYHAMRDRGGVLEVGVRKATLEGGEKEVRPELAPGDYVCLTVSDTGGGMSAEVMARIFDPYYTTKGEGEGTGLGLAVVHGIVKEYHGGIHVYSEPGKGSIFRVYLPALGRSEEPQCEASQRPLPTGTERILFVDDEAALATLGKQMIETLGYRVTVRTSPLEALELFRAKPEAFDLLITDMTMPDMSGAELAAKVMGVRPDLPVILCTGFSYTMTADKARAAGIRELVMKPMVRRDVAVIIRKVLSPR